MGTPTYTPLANVTLGSSAASVTFTSISGSYRDLVLVGNLGATVSEANALKVQFNGDTASNYSYVVMAATSSATSASGTDTSIRMYHQSSGGSSNNMFILNIMDYSATDKHKTTLSRSSNAGLLAEAEANRWANTAAITNFSIFWATSGNNITAGSTLALYGIAA